MADDASQDSTEEKDPAEALAGMAEDERPEIVAPPPQAESDPLSALTGMAQGRRDAADDLGRLAEGRGEDDEAAAGPEGAPAVPLGHDPFQARRAHAAGFGDRRPRTHAHAYKRFMIPFLIVVAAMLLVVGCISTGIVVPAWLSEEQASDPRMTLVSMASFPLAGVLLLGAWMFHRDVKQ